MICLEAVPDSESSAEVVAHAQYIGLGGETSFHEVSLICLELIPLLQELPMHVSISILRCCCSFLNLRSPSKIFLLEVKTGVCHICLQMRLHIPQAGGETGLFLL